MLSFTILGGGAGTGHAQMGTVCEEEHAGIGVVELAAIVALDCLDDGAELGLHIGKEICQSSERVRFEAQGERP